jgi:ketosteroid isomerase-like protein
MNRSLLYLSILCASVCGSFAQNQPEKLRMPGPDVQNLMLGIWSIKASYAPSAQMPNGDTGEGTEIWRPGPGGLSVIEEKHEKTAKGETDGFSIGWWDENAGGQRFVWCANDVPSGCVVPSNVAKWEGEQLVFREDSEEGGRRMTHAEIFSDITRNSFTQLLQQGEPGEVPKTTVTIRATKLSDAPMNGAVASAETDKNSESAKLVGLTNEWTDAINSRDKQKLDALMASDFALYHWNGDLAAPRLQWLDNLFNHIKIQKNTLTDSAPQAYSDFGIVTSVGDWIGSFDGKPFSQKCIVVDTWRKIDKQWKVVRRTSHCYTEDSVSGRVNWNF